MVYNMTRIADNSTSFVAFTQQVNTVLVGGWLGIMILVGTTSVAFMAFMYTTNDTNRSLSASLYLAMVMSILLRAIDLVSNLVVFMAIVGCAIAVAFTYRRD